jgi:manganese efflux pump family protein
MSIFEILFLAFALSADAFTVSLGAGASGTTQDTRSMVRLSFHLGLFQFLMPILGWMAGISIVQYVKAFDHWIAFTLLCWVAFHLIQSAGQSENANYKNDPSRGSYMVMLSVATSLDALAIGMSLALVDIVIWYPAVIIGIVTGITSFIGILLGKKLSRKIGKRAVNVGAALLILIGIRIVLDHVSLY